MSGAEPLTVRVLLFARLRELCDDQSSLELQVAPSATASDCFASLCERYPAVRPYRDTLAVAVNEEYAGWDRRVAAADVLSFIPPVSGG